MCKEGQSESRDKGGGWTTSKLGSEVSAGRRPQSHVDIAKAVSGKLALKQNPESCFCGAKVLLEEGFMSSSEGINHLVWKSGWSQKSARSGMAEYCSH